MCGNIVFEISCNRNRLICHEKQRKENLIVILFFNPLQSSAHKSARIAKILILKLEGIIKKISYEHFACESVDEESLSVAVSKNYEKNFRQQRVNERIQKL